MTKLTDADIAELSWFFTTAPPPEAYVDLHGQAYEPFGGAGYHPYTDKLLVRLVATAVARGDSQWTFVARSLAQLSGAHFEILRRAFAGEPTDLDSKEWRWAGLVGLTASARDRGRRLAIAEEHERILEVTYEAARLRGCSGPTIAMRVLERDSNVHVVLDDSQIALAALAVVATAAEKPRSSADEMFIVEVKKEILVMLRDAVGAYRDAREAVGDARRASSAKRRASSAAFLDEILGAQRRRRKPRAELQAVCDVVEEALLWGVGES